MLLLQLSFVASSPCHLILLQQTANFLCQLQITLGA